MSEELILSTSIQRLLSAQFDYEVKEEDQATVSVPEDAWQAFCNEVKAIEGDELELRTVVEKVMPDLKWIFDPDGTPDDPLEMMDTVRRTYETLEKALGESGQEVTDDHGG